MKRSGDPRHRRKTHPLSGRQLQILDQLEEFTHRALIGDEYRNRLNWIQSEHGMNDFKIAAGGIA